MRNYANFVTAMWRVDEWRALSPDEQHAYFMLATQANISAVGTVPLTVRRWASLAAGLTEAGLADSLRRLQLANFVVIDEDTEELLVRSFVRHDKGYSNPKRRPAIRDAAREVVSPMLRRALAVEFQRLDLPTEWLSDSLSAAPHVEADQTAIIGIGSGTTPIPVVDNEFPQANSLSDNLSDTISNRGRVVVTQGLGVGTATHNPSSSSRERSPTERLIMGLVGSDDDETRLMIEAIEERHRPRSLSAYVRAMSNEDLAELLAEVRGRSRPARHMPPLCGQCGPNRQITLSDGRTARCPRCHPLTAQSTSA